MRGQRGYWWRLTAAGVLVLALAGTSLIAEAAKRKPQQPKTVRVSVKPNGKEVAGAAADYPAISANGRFIAFESFGKLLKRDSGTFDLDIYVWDRKRKRLEMVSVKANGDDGTNFEGERADISGDGRWVTFASDDPLVGSDDNGLHDIYRYDRERDKVRLASLDQNDSLLYGVNDESFISGVSDDGRFVAWESEGAFVAGDSNNDSDIFVRDLRKGTTVRASVSSTGAQLPGGAEAGRDARLALSGDGRRVAWQSYDIATPEGDYGFAVDYDVFIRDLRSGTTRRVSLKSNGEEASDSENVNSGQPSISADGRQIAFASAGAFNAADSNSADDIYVRDMKTGKVRRVSVKSSGDEVSAFPGVGNSLPDISAGGRYVVWETTGNYGGGADGGIYYRDVYRHDRKSGRTTLVSVKGKRTHVDHEHQLSAVSGDGRWVVFSSMGAFTGGDDPIDFDVFLRGPLR